MKKPIELIDEWQENIQVFNKGDKGIWEYILLLSSIHSDVEGNKNGLIILNSSPLNYGILSVGKIAPSDYMK